MEADSYRYALDFSNMSQYDNEDIILTRLLQGKIDLYDYIIPYIVIHFTKSPRILFGVYAVIFGYFVLKFYHLINDDWKKKKNIYVWIIIIVIFMLNPYMNINGVRYWTASWCFFTSFIAYFLYHNKIWLTGLLLTPIIHISFLIPLFFVLLTVISKQTFNYNQLYYITIITFIIGILLPLDKIISILPAEFGIFDHFEAYIDEGYISENTNLSNKRNIIFILICKLPYLFVFNFLYTVRKLKLKLDNEDLVLFYFVYLLLSFLFIFERIPSVARMYYISYMLLIYLTFRIYKRFHLLSIKKMILFIPVFFLGSIYDVITIHNLVLSNLYFNKPIWNILEYALSLKNL